MKNCVINWIKLYEKVLTAFLSFLSVVVASCALIFSVMSYQWTSQAAAGVAIRDNIVQFLAAHRLIIEHHYSSSLPGYDALSEPAKIEVGMCFGFLVSTIDAMNSAGDSRAASWAQHLDAFSGPMLRGLTRATDYAREPETLKQVEAAKSRAAAIDAARSIKVQYNP